MHPARPRCERADGRTMASRSRSRAGARRRQLRAVIGAWLTVPIPSTVATPQPSPSPDPGPTLVFADGDGTPTPGPIAPPSAPPSSSEAPPATPPSPSPSTPNPGLYPPPPSMCVNTCNIGSSYYYGASEDGGCDDGGEGAEYWVCATGTDCADCGVREYHPCAVGSCFMQWRNNSRCEPGCNNWACNYDDDCSVQEIYTTCSKGISTSLADEPPPAQGYTGGAPYEHPFEATVRVSGLELRSDAVTGATLAFAVVAVVVAWSDDRLFDASLNPCRREDVMQSMIDLDARTAQNADLTAEVNAKMARLWTPSVFVDPHDQKEAGTLTSRAFTMDEANRTMTLATTTAVTVTQDFDMTFYPFDHQSIRLSFAVGSGARLTNCPTAPRLNEDEKPGGAWQFNGPPTATLERAVVSSQQAYCVYRIPIRRNPLGFIVSQIFPCIVIVFGGLGGIWLDPKIPGLISARVGLMITSMLVVTNLAARVKLRLGTPMWLDAFNTIQIFLLLVALLSTLAVHVSMRSGRKDRAMALDQTMHTAGWIAYVGYMTAVLLFGVTQSGWVFLGLAAATTVLVILIIHCNMKAILFQRQERRRQFIEQLKKTDLSSVEGEELAQQLFQEFDDDKSGSISAAEAANILRRWQPKLNLKDAYMRARGYFSDGEMSFGGFLTMLNTEHMQLASSSSRGGVNYATRARMKTASRMPVAGIGAISAVVAGVGGIAIAETLSRGRKGNEDEMLDASAGDVDGGDDAGGDDGGGDDGGGDDGGDCV